MIGRLVKEIFSDTPNERSLSFLVTFGQFGYLISGDLIGRAAGAENARVEEAVGVVPAGFEVEVLHVNHHCADDDSDEVFLELIRPTIAIVLASNGNTHGHSDRDILRRLVEADVETIYQTEWGTMIEPTEPDIRDRQAIWQQDVGVRTDGQIYQLSS